MHVLHTPAKQELLRFLSLHPASSTAEVATAFEVSVEAARQRLTDLENAGVIVGSVAHGQRRGRIVTFRVDETRVRALIDELAGYVLGQ